MNYKNKDFCRNANSLSQSPINSPLRIISPAIYVSGAHHYMSTLYNPDDLRNDSAIELVNKSVNMIKKEMDLDIYILTN